MAPRSSVNPQPAESLLSKKKQEILERYMAIFEQKWNQRIDQSSLAPPPACLAALAATSKKATKRARDEDCCSAGSSGSGGEGNGVEEMTQQTKRDSAQTNGAGGRSVKKIKRTKPEGQSEGKKFACPFAKNNPGKYKFVKTCCGPGWEDVHRVKEHVYRRHSLKKFCPRCFDLFDNEEALRNHARAEERCKLRTSGQPDTVNEAQEKALHARAKAKSSEDDKWVDMYQIIFPGAKVPSPYYDSAEDTASAANNAGFKDQEDCREYLREEVPRLVRPIMKKWIDDMFRGFEEKMEQKTTEVIKQVEYKLLQTWYQRPGPPPTSSSSPPSSPSLETSSGTCPDMTPATTSEVDKGSAEGLDGEGEEEEEAAQRSMQQMLDSLNYDNAYNSAVFSSLGLNEIIESVDVGCLPYPCGDSGYQSFSEQGGYGVGLVPGYVPAGQHLF